MNAQDIREKVNFLRMSQDTIECNTTREAIESDGWKVGLYAYPHQVTHTQSRRNRRPLKTPRWEWHIVAHWYKDEDVVYYYNNTMRTKEMALDFTRRFPLPEKYRKKLEGGGMKLDGVLFE